MVSSELVHQREHCCQVESAVWTRDFDGDGVPDEVVAMMTAHIPDCPICQREAMRHSLLANLLRRSGPDLAPPSLGLRIHTQIVTMSISIG
jgi:hypothetical protein